MCTRNLICGIVMVLLAVNVSMAADKFWDGEGADNSWLTPANWDADALPADGDRVFMDVAGETIVVPAAKSVVPRKIIGPCWDAVGTVTLTVAGSLSNSSYWYLGYESGGVGILNVNGTVTTRDLNVGGGDGYAGVVNVSGLLDIYGAVANTGAYFGNDPVDGVGNGTASINVSGGTLRMTQLAPLGPNATIDIVDGKVILLGDQTTMVNSYISTDQILADGGAADVLVSTYDEEGQTYTRVIPEPATICLVGLGVLGFLRKRK